MHRKYQEQGEARGYGPEYEDASIKDARRRTDEAGELAKKLQDEVPREHTADVDEALEG